MFFRGYWLRYAVVGVEDSYPPTQATDYGTAWRTRCPDCGIIHGKEWHTETDLCKPCRDKVKSQNHMHYKNGRPAQNGDKVVLLGDSWNAPVAGILYNAVAGNDSCNGRIAPTSPTDPCPNLANVLHADDVAVAAAAGLIVDSTPPKAPANPVEPPATTPDPAAT